MKWYNRYLIFPVSILLSINSLQAQTCGCTDPPAINYNPSAMCNDGSCIYSPASVTPASGFSLEGALAETSGLIIWNNLLWTHNDNNDINLYALDTLDGTLIRSYPLNGTINNDWEDISHDNDYIYIGDFGNNQNGNRTNLKILKISKNSILQNSPAIETINFSYSDQTDFTPTGTNNTDFDCEAFIVSSDSIYLFTKQYISNQTSVYSLPKTPGTYTAKLLSAYDVEGLITGAAYLESKKLIVLCGYNTLLEPFLFLLYDFNAPEYFGGNKREITIPLPFHQVEGIATTDGLKYFITNEFVNLPLYGDIPQKLNILDLHPFLGNYLATLPSTIPDNPTTGSLIIYPVPAYNFIKLKTDRYPLKGFYFLINYLGQVVQSGRLSETVQSIDISDLVPGIYMLKVGEYNQWLFKIIVR